MPAAQQQIPEKGSLLVQGCRQRWVQARRVPGGERRQAASVAAAWRDLGGTLRGQAPQASASQMLTRGCSRSHGRPEGRAEGSRGRLVGTEKRRLCDHAGPHARQTTAQACHRHCHRRAPAALPAAQRAAARLQPPPQPPSFPSCTKHMVLLACIGIYRQQIRCALYTTHSPHPRASRLPAHASSEVNDSTGI